MFKVDVNAGLRWQATMITDKVYEGSPVGFTLDVDIDSDVELSEIKYLVTVAKKDCFIEQTLSVANKIRHRLRTGDDWIDV